MAQNLIAARCSTFIVAPLYQKRGSSIDMTSYNKNDVINVTLDIRGISTVNIVNISYKPHVLDFTKYEHLGGKNWILGRIRHGDVAMETITI